MRTKRPVNKWHSKMTVVAAWINLPEIDGVGYLDLGNSADEGVQCLVAVQRKKSFGTSSFMYFAGSQISFWCVGIANSHLLSTSV